MNELIALDAGHGINTYPPSKGVPGMAEFAFNSAAVRYTIPHLERNGFRVLLTQPLNGNDVPLTQRTNLANQQKADLLLSYHADFSTNKDARGHWGFYWHTSKMCETLAALWSEEIAKMTGSHRRGNLPSKPGEWTNFHMVRESKMPAVLMEHGFMSNAQDLALLKSDAFRRKCGEAAARAVCRYFNRSFKPEPVANPNPPTTVTPPKKEEPFMNEKAIVINSEADVPAARRLSRRIGAVIIERVLAEEKQLAKEIFIVGGGKGKLKADKFTDLSGKDFFETVANVKKYIG